MELGVKNDQQEIERIRTEAKVKYLLSLAKAANVRPSELRAIGPRGIAAIALRHLGKPIDSSRVTDALNEPEFESNE
jgi:hypothetical protein